MTISHIQPVSLQVERMDAPLGVESRRPSLSWRFHTNSERRGQRQKSYRILVADSLEKLEEGAANMWDSGFVESETHTGVPYEGSALESGRRYYWKVQISDDEGRESAWSSYSSWSMGLLEEEAWEGKWIGVTEGLVQSWTAGAAAPGEFPMPLLRREFMLEVGVKRATAYICGLGHFELRLNGENVTDNVLEPGWTDYDETTLYCTYDVTSRVREGANAIGIMLGNGFFHVNGTRYTKFQGSYGLPKVIMQLEIELTDGRTVSVATGSDWSISPGPIVFSCVYGGEDYDGTREQSGWDRPGFASWDSWSAAEVVQPPQGRLRSYVFPPNKVMRTYETQTVTQPSPGVFVYDLGANMSGRPYIRVRGERGTTIKLVPGELLDERGFVNQAYTGSPISLSYTLNGEAEEEWVPRFSYQGFRYVQVEGAAPLEPAGTTTDHRADAKAVMLELKGQMIYPDLFPSGSFQCSRDDWNGIHGIIMQAVLSNIKSVLTDCPHREKLGWLEQYQLMGPSIMYNYDLSAFLRKTFEDMREAQTEEGLIPDIAPEYTVFQHGFRDSPEWGSAYIITPWYHANWYGFDGELLSRHYDAMKRYLHYLLSRADGYIVRHGLGDWGNIWQNFDGNDRTPLGITATATFYYDCLILSNIAEKLGEEEDAAQFKELAHHVKQAFNREWFHRETNTYATGTQTSFSAPLAYGLAEPDVEEAVLEALLDVLKKADYTITSGEVGHRYLLAALTRLGRPEIVERMLEQTSKPYYAFQVANGATSLAEYWDGPVIGHSQNHFMMGHIEEWFHAVLAGIRIDYAGDGKYPLLVQPYVASGVDWVSASQLLPQGRLDLAWRKHSDGTFELTLQIPVSASVVVGIPTVDTEKVTEGGRVIASLPELTLLEERDGYVFVRAGSGNYVFHSVLPAR